jgi:hypothetical protein
MRNLKRIDSVGAAARLLLVVAALAGFLAMHGLAATDSAGAHHLGSVVAQQHDMDVTTPVADGHRAIAHVLGAAPAQDPAQHDAAMAGCVFILLALAGAIALRAFWVTAAGSTSVRNAGRAPSHGPARAPPCPVFVSLCVFRL